MNPFRIVLACMLASLGFLAGDAGAQLITKFNAGNGSQPIDITAGPDGNLWFTKHWGNWIGRITPAGVVTEFTAGTFCQQHSRYPAPLFPGAITAGPDGNLWFTEPVCGRIGRMTPQGVITEFSTGISHPYGITAGPDGNLWFTTFRSALGRMTPDGVVTEFSITGIAGGITTGPDGNLWFTESVRSPPTAPTVGWIGRITPAGVVTEFSAGITDGALATSITAGPDGNLWFTESVPFPFPAPAVGRIGRITPAGVVTEFNAGITGLPGDITAGPDGNLWFTEVTGIGWITPAGVVTELRFTFTGTARGITAGPDGNLWFTDSAYNQIGRITTTSSSADLALSNSDSPDPVTVGSPLTYTITVTNDGPSAASGVTMTDTLLPTLTFVSATPSQGICTSTGAITCSLGSLGNGSSATVTIVATPSQVGGVSNTASVTANEADPDTSNNSATAVTTINGSSGGTSVNVALAANGGVAIASSTFSAGFPVSAVNNGERAGLNFGAGGVWKDGTFAKFPDRVEIDFSSAQTIDRVVIYSAQDNNTNPVEPTDTMTFNKRGITAFDVQAWTGSAWITLGSVTGNTLVKRTVSFSAITTSKIRVVIKASAGLYSLLTEIEAWTH